MVYTNPVGVGVVYIYPVGVLVTCLPCGGSMVLVNGFVFILGLSKLARYSMRLMWPRLMR